MRLSNANLQRSAIETETRLIENLDLLRNTQLARAQDSLQLKDAMLDLEHQDHRGREPLRALPASRDGRRHLAEVMESTRNDLARLHGKRELLKQRIEQEDVLGRNQLKQAKESIERLT